MSKVLLSSVIQQVTCKLTLVAVCVVTLFTSNISIAQDDEVEWVFDVEFFAFKRTMADDHPEDFSAEALDMSSNNAFSAYTLHLLQRSNPNFNVKTALPLCGGNRARDENRSRNDVTEWPDETKLNALGDVLESNDADNILSLTPQTIVGHIQSIQYIDITPSVRWFVDQQTWLKNEALLAQSLSCIESLEYPEQTQIPTFVFNPSDDQVYMTNDSPTYQLLSDQDLYLSKLVDKISAQKGIEPLLFKAWRQAVVFGENNALYYQIIGGDKLKVDTTIVPDNMLSEAAISEATLETTQANLNEIGSDAFVGGKIEEDGAYANDLLSIESTASETNKVKAQLTNIKNALETQPTIIWEEPAAHASGESVAQLSRSLLEQSEDNQASLQVNVQNWPTWELNGIFKVYLDTVNRVPYLHIDSELVHASKKIDSQGLESIDLYPAKQRRRIISKQIHYFDHPAFGVIVRLQRYEKPDPTVFPEY